MGKGGGAYSKCLNNTPVLLVYFWLMIRISVRWWFHVWWWNIQWPLSLIISWKCNIVNNIVLLQKYKSPEWSYSSVKTVFANNVSEVTLSERDLADEHQEKINKSDVNYCMQRRERDHHSFERYTDMGILLKNKNILHYNFT